MLSFVRRGNAASSVVSVVLLSMISFTTLADQQGDNETYDGLVPVPGARVQAAFIDPRADFSVFKRVVVFEPRVAFRANWERDQNRNSRIRRVSASDMERIKADVAELFKEVFIERLEANDGYEVVDVIGDDVLVIRPSIIDLNVNVPNTSPTAPTQSISATAGSATLFMELFDSVSGDIIGRAADRRTIGQAQGAFTLRGGAANRQEARQMFTRWADKLREFLDSHYTDK